MAGGRQTVLVVDDERSVLTTYGMILQRHGYEVTTAISSAEAMEHLREKRGFDLLLCDYSLEQEHTGFEVIDMARANDPCVPAILITGYASKETADQAREKNITILFKPIDIQEFFTTLSGLSRNANAEGSKEKGSGEAGEKDGTCEAGADQGKSAGRPGRGSAVPGSTEK